MDFFASQVYTQWIGVLPFWSSLLLLYEKFMLPFEGCFWLPRENELLPSYCHGEHRHIGSLTHITCTVPLTAVCSSKDGEEGRPVWLVTLPLSWHLAEMAGVKHGHVQEMHLRVAIKHLPLGICIYKVRHNFSESDACGD